MHTEIREFQASHNPSSAEKTQSLIVIECSICHYLGFSYMAYPEVDALLSGGTIVRHCESCNARTVWRKVNTRTGLRDRMVEQDSDDQGEVSDSRKH